MLKALLIVACLLVLSQNAASKKHQLTAKEQKLVHELSDNATMEMVNVAKSRASDAAAAKKSRVSRLMIDRSELRYSRDLYQDIFGDDKNEVAEFYDKYCNRDIVMEADLTSSPVSPLEIATESQSLKDFLMTVESDLDQHRGLMQEIENILKGADRKDPAVIEQVEHKTDTLVDSILKQDNGLEKEGLCALDELSLLIFRMIEHGTQDFSSHEYCYDFVTLFYQKLEEFDYDIHDFAEHLGATSFEAMIPFSRAIRDDMKCMYRQINDLKQKLTAATKLNNRKNAHNGWEFAVEILWEMYNLITEYHTLVGGLHDFSEGKKEILAYLEGGSSGGSGAFTRGESKKMLQELRNFLLKKAHGV